MKEQNKNFASYLRKLITPKGINAKLFPVIAALPVLVIAALVLHYGVNIPVHDEWELIPYIQKIDEGGLPLGDLLNQHNEHRLVFPRIAMLSIAHFTNWNLIVMMLASLAVQVVTLIFIWKAIKRVTTGLRAQLLIVVASILLFSPMQWENWIWGWQIQWYMTILGAISAFYFGSYLPLKKRWLNHALSIGGATLATFSLAGGMVTWVSLLGLLLVRKQFKAIGVYLSIFIAEVAIYAKGYHSVGGHTPLDSLFSYPLDYFRYIFLYLGGSITTDDQIAPILGFVGLSLFLVFSVKALLEKNSRSYIWVMVGLFVIANAAFTGSGRFLLGPEQALSSRYTSFSVFWLLSLVMLLSPYIASRILRKTRLVQPATISILIVMLGLFSLHSIAGVARLRAKSISNASAKECLNKQVTPDSICFSKIHPTSPELDRINTERLQYLRANDLAGMKDPVK